MEISTVLSVTIGLIFVWLIISLAVMNIEEWIVSKLRWRSKMLETTIRNLLADPGLTDQFYNHPLIRSLFSGNDGSNKPSYIPSSQFTLTLFDIVVNAGTDASLLQQQLYKLRLDVAMLNRSQQKAAHRRLNLILALTRRALVSETGTAAVNATLDSVRSEINRLAVDYPKLQASVDASLLNVKVQKEQIDSIFQTLQKSEVTHEVNQRQDPTGDCSHGSYPPPAKADPLCAGEWRGRVHLAGRKHSDASQGKCREMVR